MSAVFFDGKTTVWERKAKNIHSLSGNNGVVSFEISVGVNRTPPLSQDNSHSSRVSTSPVSNGFLGDEGVNVRQIPFPLRIDKALSNNGVNNLTLSFKGNFSARISNLMNKISLGSDWKTINRLMADCEAQGINVKRGPKNLAYGTVELLEILVPLGATAITALASIIVTAIKNNKKVIRLSFHKNGKLKAVDTTNLSEKEIINLLKYSQKSASENDMDQIDNGN